MNRILEIGFRFAGSWFLDGDSLKYEIKRHANSKNVLYAFISNGEIKYIGKTTQQFAKRMNGYRKPAKTQSTNINNNQNIKSLLNRGEPVDIFILADNGLLNYGGFPINLAAGLEDSLIHQLEPKWNGGKKEVGLIKLSEGQLDETITERPEPKARIFSSSMIRKSQFKIQLGVAYYNQGFFNVPVKYENTFGSDGEEIEIFVGSEDKPLMGYINRTANTTSAPRIMGGKRLKQWIMSKFEQGEYIEVTVFSSNTVKIDKSES